MAQLVFRGNELLVLLQEVETINRKVKKHNRMEGIKIGSNFRRIFLQNCPEAKK